MRQCTPAVMYGCRDRRRLVRCGATRTVATATCGRCDGFLKPGARRVGEFIFHHTIASRTVLPEVTAINKNPHFRTSSPYIVCRGALMLCDGTTKSYLQHYTSSIPRTSQFCLSYAFTIIRPWTEPIPPFVSRNITHRRTLTQIPDPHNIFPFFNHLTHL